MVRVVLAASRKCPPLHTHTLSTRFFGPGQRRMPWPDPGETLLGVGDQGGGSILAVDALLELTGMHAPCVPCRGEARRGRLVPMKQESTDRF